MEPGRPARRRPAGRPSARRARPAAPCASALASKASTGDRAAVPVAADALGSRRAAPHAGRLDGLALRLVGREALADLEQRHVAEAAVGVALRRLEQARQQARAHVGEVGRDRVGERQLARRRRRTARPRALAMNDQVTASTRPRAASARLASRVRFWISVRIGLATVASRRGSGSARCGRRPTMRMTSSTRSALPSTSGRQDGGATLTRSPVPATRKPSCRRIAFDSAARHVEARRGAAPRSRGTR